MKMYRILVVALWGALSTLLLISGQTAFAEPGALDFSEEESDLGLSLDASIDVPVIFVLRNNNPDCLSAGLDVEVAYPGSDSYQLTATIPVSYRAYDLYRAYRVPFPRSH